MKSKVLELLRAHKGKPVSGQEISGKFGVSRTAVWKAIEALRTEGYIIKSSPRLGYELAEEPDILGPTGIMAIAAASGYLDDGRFYPQIDSTNSEAKRFAEDHPGQSALFVAEEQTAGRGRLGRQWMSEQGTGLYLSLLIRPEIEPSRASLVTQVAAVATAEAVEAVTGLEAQIKWPNDLIVDGKKVCGILAELSAEMTAVNYLVVGIGINVNQSDLPGEIQDKASSLRRLTGRKIDRQTLLRAVVERFGHYLGALQDDALLERMHQVYRLKSATLGKEVRLLGKADRTARVLDITKEGELLVIYPNGERERIHFGEVSVRGLDFYA
ncbi:biotin--[acetyl-CoA-carboxylase] ligase [Acidaminobacter hydrogenoformans]|uniref:biotin--[acetyl-CoA-carboxylase] ligase n=1 Tax=Acidaminobacter hydrogenoformans TaxID=65403 RepID=UPI00147E82AD|nr:biotin--[acetyl-CoA-carboxylase] ligase [Acidaminobacter hydrogenoformans]